MSVSSSSGCVAVAVARFWHVSPAARPCRQPKPSTTSARGPLLNRLPFDEPRSLSSLSRRHGGHVLGLCLLELVAPSTLAAGYVGDSYSRGSQAKPVVTCPFAIQGKREKRQSPPPDCQRQPAYTIGHPELVHLQFASTKPVFIYAYLTCIYRHACVNCSEALEHSGRTLPLLPPHPSIYRLGILSLSYRLSVSVLKAHIHPKQASPSEHCAISSTRCAPISKLRGLCASYIHTHAPLSTLTTTTR